MKIKEAIQVNLDEIDLNSIDLLICSCGYEERSRYLANLLCASGKAAIKNKVVFHFANDSGDKVSSENTSFFRSQGFEFIEITHFDLPGKASRELDRFLRIGVSSTIFNILVDYSSMTRVIYSEILRFFHEIKSTCTVNIYFVYVPSEYDGPGDFKPNFFVGPIAGFDGKMSLPQTPIMLIVGLGYDEIRALGLIEYFDLAFERTSVFLTDKSFNPRFAEEAERNNKDLLGRIPQENIYAYPLLDIRTTGNMLSSLIEANRKHNRIVIAPIGPKPFTLISLLLGIKYPEISIYRVSQNSDSLSARIANERGVTITCLVTFVDDNS